MSARLGTFDVFTEQQTLDSKLKATRTFILPFAFFAKYNISCYQYTLSAKICFHFLLGPSFQNSQKILANLHPRRHLTHFPWFQSLTDWAGLVHLKQQKPQILHPLSTNMKEEHEESSLVSEKKELTREEKYWEQYQNNVLPAIKQALKDDWLNVRMIVLQFFPKVTLSW